jgi:hypothetical protein
VQTSRIPIIFTSRLLQGFLKKDFWRILRDIQVWFLEDLRDIQAWFFGGFLGISKDGFCSIFRDVQA